MTGALAEVFEGSLEFFWRGACRRLFDLGDDFQESEAFLGFFVALNVLYDGFGVTVLGDDVGGAGLGYLSDYFSGV